MRLISKPFFSGISPISSHINYSEALNNKRAFPTRKDIFENQNLPLKQDKRKVHFAGVFGPVQGHPPDVATVMRLQQQPGTRGQVCSFNHPNQPHIYLATASDADIADRALTKITNGQSQNNPFLIDEGNEMLEELADKARPAADFARETAH